MKRATFRVVAITLLAAMFASSPPVAAWATLEEIPPPIATTTTNPNAWDDPETWWREGWGESLAPQFELNMPTLDSWEHVIGSIYTVDRDASVNVIDTSNPDQYYRTAKPEGTHYLTTLDMPGILAYPPPGGWGPLEPGATYPIEGRWNYHYVFYSNLRYSNLEINIDFGIDLGKPRPVTGLALKSSLNAVIPPDTWINTNRIHATWNPGPYDDLSGVGYYQVLIDDKPYIPETNPDPKQGRVYTAPSGATTYTLPASITLENPPAGAHKLSIVCVDRALNEGPETSMMYYSDPDTPTIDFVSPGGGEFVAGSPIEASAADAGGVQWVSFQLDGNSIGTATVAPYVITPDIGSLSLSDHTLSATVKDMAGRTVTVTKSVTGRAPNTTGTTLGLSGTVLGSSLIPWVNTLTPGASFSASRPVDGFLYTLDRSVSSVPTLPYDPSRPPAAYLPVPLSAGGSPLVFGTLDVAGWTASQTTTRTPGAGESNPSEGMWYLHGRSVITTASPALSNVTAHKSFRVDVTPPRAPTGVNLVAGSASDWSSTARRDIMWDNPLGSGGLAYDLLSGETNYTVSVNGVDASTQRVPLTLSSAYCSVEDLRSGTNVIGVSVTDLAGNRSAETTIGLLVDSDAPEIEITTPSTSELLMNSPITASATDQGGVQDVSFWIDGVSLGTVTSPPYSVFPDLKTFPLGAHILTATVRDMAGRTASASKAVTLVDWTAPTQSGNDAPTAIAIVDTIDDAGTRWTNLRNPVASFTSSMPVDGFLYTLDHSPSTVPSLTFDPAVTTVAFFGVTWPEEKSSVAEGPIDLAGWAAAQRTPAPAVSGAADPIEGKWWIHGRALVTAATPALSSASAHYAFDVDVTPPRTPTGLKPADGPANVWSRTIRRDIVWDNPLGSGMPQYDSLSGDAQYAVSLNGVDTSQFRVPRSLATGFSSIENLAPGRNIVGVSVIDHAGNRGPETKMTLLADPDVPTVSLTAPAASGRYVDLSATATDQAGIAWVEFAVDGVPVYHDTAAPYQVTSVDMGAVGLGQHNISATVCDMAGRKVTSTKSMNVADITAPSVTNVSGAPSPFFPIKRDRYLDDFKASFRVSEKATVTMQIYNSAGTLIREISGLKAAGGNAIVWNGRSNTSAPKVGTYTWRLKAVDTYGNTTTTSKKTVKIQSYILVRLSSNKVRVVYH